MSNIILYSTGCPACAAVENMLKNKSIPYTKTDDVEELINHGFTRVPVLQLGEEYIEDIEKILSFIKNYGG